jgi:phosphoglycerol transferase
MSDETIVSDTTDAPARPARRLGPWLREAAGYATGVVLSLAILWQVLGLKKADFRVPLHLPGDGVYYGLLVKTMLETGWVHVNPALGAPFQLELYDFAHFDNLHLGIMKVMGWFSHDWALVFNAFFLLTFPLTTLTTLVLLRAFRVPWAVALAVALLYAFQPFHFLRGMGHIMLASYYLIPLQVMVCLWLAEPRSLRRAGCESGWPFASGRFWAAVGIALAASSAGHYFASFGCLFALVAGAGCSLAARRWGNLRDAVLVCAVTFGGFAINLAPNIVYWSEYGPNRDVSAKQPEYSETYGLKVTQLLMPVPSHRLPAFERLGAKYRTTSPVMNENLSSSVGLLAALGFLALIVPAVMAPGRSATGLSFATLGRLTLAAVLVASVGGFGNAFSYLVTPQIHGYNRMSIWLALFGLLAAALVVTRAAACVRSVPVRCALTTAAALGMLAWGLYDQTSPAFRPDYAARKAEFQKHRAYAQTVQASVPAGTMVFQYPLSSFPYDNGQIGYSHMHMYLHTTGLRWSDPSMLYRRGSVWQQTVVDQKPEPMLRTLALAGFGGLLIDTRLNRPQDLELLKTATELTKVEPIHDGGTRYFFDLRPYAGRLREGYPPEQWEQMARDVFSPVYMVWGGSWGGLEKGTAAPWTAWHWCLKPKAELVVVNEADHPVSADLRLTLYPPGPTARNVTIESALFREAHQVPAGGEKVERKLTLPPGRHRIEFRCDGEPARFPYAELWFRVDSLSLEPSGI